MSANCANSPPAKWEALKEVKSVVAAQVSSGAVPASLQKPVTAELTKTVGAHFQAGIANGADVRSLVRKYLPSALAKASALGRAGRQSPSQGSASPQGATPPTTPGAAPFGAPPGSPSQTQLAGLLDGRVGAGSFFDAARRDPASGVAAGVIPGSVGSSTRGASLTPSAPAATPAPASGIAWSPDGTPGGADMSGTIGGSSKSSGVVAVSGLEVTSDEVRDYFNGFVRMDDDSFSALLWLGEGKNPMLALEALSYAKRLHNEIVLPAATYYKGLIYGDPNFPVRLGQIVYGIVSPGVVRSELRGGTPSRHLLGQAVNFRINGIEDLRVVQDIASGAIKATYGTLALSAGVHASLPFRAANGQMVERLQLWSSSGVPNYVGYKFN